MFNNRDAISSFYFKIHRLQRVKQLKKYFIFLFISLLITPGLFCQNSKLDCDIFPIEFESQSNSIQEIFVDQKTNIPYFISKRSIKSTEIGPLALPRDFGEVFEITDNFIYTRTYKHYHTGTDANKSGAQVIINQFKLDFDQIILTDSTIEHASEGGPGPSWYWNKNGVRIPAEFAPFYSFYKDTAVLITKKSSDGEKIKYKYQLLHDQDTVHSGFLKSGDFENRIIKKTRLVKNGILVYTRNAASQKRYLALFSLNGDLKWERTIQVLKTNTSDWEDGIFIQNETDNIITNTYQINNGIRSCIISLIDTNTGKTNWDFTKAGKDLQILQTILIDNYVGFITGKIVITSSKDYHYADINIEILDNKGNSVCSKKVDGNYIQTVAIQSVDGLKVVAIPYSQSH